MHLAIVVPTYNEVDNIKKLIDGIFSLPLEIGDKITVVLVDDNSLDGTQQILVELKGRHREKLIVIERTVERGRGTAGIRGFQECLKLPCDCIMEMDADFSHDPKHIPKFMAFIKHYDVVIGSRYVEGGYVSDWPMSRKIVSACSNFIYRFVLGTKIHDLSGGFKCYRYNVIQSLNFNQFYSYGYSIGIEILFRCYKLGYTFLEIPIAFQNRSKGKSKFRIREATGALAVVFRLFLKYGRAVRLFDRIPGS